MACSVCRSAALVPSTDGSGGLVCAVCGTVAYDDLGGSFVDRDDAMDAGIASQVRGLVKRRKAAVHNLASKAEAADDMDAAMQGATFDDEGVADPSQGPRGSQQVRRSLRESAKASVDGVGATNAYVGMLTALVSANAGRPIDTHGEDGDENEGDDEDDEELTSLLRQLMEGDANLDELDSDDAEGTERTPVSVSAAAKDIWAAFLTNMEPVLSHARSLNNQVAIRGYLGDKLNAWNVASALLAAHWCAGVPILGVDVRAAVVSGRWAWVEDVEASMQDARVAATRGLAEVHEHGKHFPHCGQGTRTFGALAINRYENRGRIGRNKHNKAKADMLVDMIEQRALSMLPDGVVPPIAAITYRAVAAAGLPHALAPMCERIRRVLEERKDTLAFPAYVVANHVPWVKLGKEKRKTLIEALPKNTAMLAAAIQPPRWAVAQAERINDKTGFRRSLHLFGRPRLLVGATIVTAARIAFSNLRYRGLRSWPLSPTMKHGKSVRVLPLEILNERRMTDETWMWWYRVWRDKALARYSGGRTTRGTLAHFERMSAGQAQLMLASLAWELPPRASSEQSAEVRRTLQVLAQGAGDGAGAAGAETASGARGEEASKPWWKREKKLFSHKAKRHKAHDNKDTKRRNVLIYRRNNRVEIQAEALETRFSWDDIAKHRGMAMRIGPPLVPPSLEVAAARAEDTISRWPEQSDEAGRKSEDGIASYDPWHVANQVGMPYWHVLRAVGVVIGADEEELHRFAACTEAVLREIKHPDSIVVPGQGGKDDENLENLWAAAAPVEAAAPPAAV